MKTLDFKEFDEEAYRKELIQKRASLVKEPLIQEFLNKNQLRIEDISNITLLEEYLRSYQECARCHSLSECVKTNEGRRMSIEYNGGVIIPVCEYCKYYQERQAADEHLRYFVYNDIPDIYKNVFLSNIKVLENIDAKKLFVLLNQIIKGEYHNGLYIYGAFGVGKTYSCIAFANELALQHKKVAFVKMNDFANKIRVLVTKDSNKMYDIVESLKEVPYLVIDDIGAESITAFVRDDLLFNILDYRMSHNLLTVFTSNHSQKTLLDTFTYDKNGNRDELKAGRLLERIRKLGLEFYLSGENHR